MSSDNDFPGSPIARGPMGGDQYTQVHNLVFRDTRLSAKAMGVFGHLSTHTESWRVTEKTIAANMRDKRDAVRSALQELERYSYLIRERERSQDGTLSGSVWFVTDLPAQLRGLGVTDDELIAKQTREHFEQWRNCRSGPKSENPSLGFTCENADAASPKTLEPVDNSPVAEGFPSAAPKTENPTLADPTLDNPPPKKTKSQKTKTPETPERSEGVSGEEEQLHPSSSVGEVQTARKEDADGWRDEHHERDTKQHQDAAHEQPAPEQEADRLLAGIERRHQAHLDARRGEYVATVAGALAVMPHREIVSLLGNGLNLANSRPGALVDRLTRKLPAAVEARRQEQKVEAQRRESHTRELRAQRERPRVATPDDQLRGLQGVFLPSRLRDAS